MAKNLYEHPFEASKEPEDAMIPEEVDPVEEAAHEARMKELHTIAPQNETEGLQWLIKRLTKKLGDEHDRAKMEEELAAMDSLTGLLNRRGFDKAAETIETERRRTTKEGKRPYTLFIADLDHFKHVNDQYGHDIGDIVLKEVARYLEDRLRKGDAVISRHGGEEFLVLMPGATAEDVKKKFEGKSIEIEIPQLENGPAQKIVITLSGGIKELAPGESINEARAAADAALYRAKQAGRNKIEIAGEDADENKDTTNKS